jgi:hypothetical protein
VFLFTQVAYARHYESSDALDDFFKNDLGDALKTAAIVVVTNVASMGYTTYIVAPVMAPILKTTTLAIEVGSAVGSLAGQLTSLGCVAGGMDARQAAWVGAGVGAVAGSYAGSVMVNGGSTLAGTSIWMAPFAEGALTNTLTNMAINGIVAVGMAETGYQVSQTEWGKTWGQVVVAAATPLVTYGVAQGVQWVGPRIGLNYTGAPSRNAALAMSSAVVLEQGAVALAKELTKDESEETQALAVMAAGTLGGVAGAWAGTSLEGKGDYFKENYGKILGSKFAEYAASYAIDKVMGESKTYDQMFLKSTAIWAVAQLGAAAITGGIAAYNNKDFWEAAGGYLWNKSRIPSIGPPLPVRQDSEGNYVLDSYAAVNYGLRTVNYYGLNNENIMEAGKIYGGNITYDYAVLANMSQGLQNDAAGSLAHACVPGLRKKDASGRLGGAFGGRVGGATTSPALSSDSAGRRGISNLEPK